MASAPSDHLAAGRRVPEVLAETAKAGWRTDGAGNLAALPATPDAQRKLDSVGVKRLVHNSGHPDWHQVVDSGVREVILPPLWFMDVDPSALWEFDHLLLSDESLGMPNYREVSRALHELQTRTNSLISDDVPLPDGFPAPQLVLLESGFAADCFTFNGYWFCSRRLREALDQPERVVQFTPSKSSPAATRFGRRIMV